MDIIDAVLNLWSTISNWFGILIKNITWFFNNVTTVLWYILSILKALWFWLVSLLSWIWDLIVKVFDWGVFSNVWSTFWTLTDFIWVPAVVFISTLFLIIIFRIWLSFVFSIFKMDLKYKTMQKQEHDYAVANDPKRKK